MGLAAAARLVSPDLFKRRHTPPRLSCRPAETQSSSLEDRALMTSTAVDGALRHAQTVFDVFEHVARREAVRAEIDDDLRPSLPRLGYHHNNKQLNRVHAWSVNGHQVRAWHCYVCNPSLARHRVFSIACSVRRKESTVTRSRAETLTPYRHARYLTSFLFLADVGACTKGGT
jgi:hypothetical protein